MAESKSHLIPTKVTPSKLNATETTDDNLSLIQHHQLRRKPFQLPPQDDQKRKIAFLHVGKTGGTTASILLKHWDCNDKKKSKGVCLDEMNHVPVTTLSKRIDPGGYYHHIAVDYTKQYTSFVVTTRDPLDRAISAFLMHHPANGQELWPNSRRNDVVFRDCFPTLEDFASFLPSTGEYTNPSTLHQNDRDSKMTTSAVPGRPRRRRPTKCSQVALSALTGRVQDGMYVEHLFYNYEQYVGPMPVYQSEVFAIRISHFWQDWKAINRLLGGKDDEIQILDGDAGHARNSAKMNYAVTKDSLTKEGKEAMCFYLRREYELYLDVLYRAVNLSSEDVKEMHERARKQCPGIFGSIEAAHLRTTTHVRKRL